MTTTVHIENTVREYAAWQEAFDKFEAFRAEHGVRSYRISRGVVDPRQVTVDLHFDSRGEAEAFLPRLQQIWSTPQSQRMLLDHTPPVLLEVVRDRVLETSS
jgi:ribosomal protein L35AE/L33A